MLDGHIDEPVLGFRLHHPRPLRPHHLNRFGNVNVTVDAYKASSVEPQENVQSRRKGVERTTFSRLTGKAHLVWNVLAQHVPRATALAC